ncbi:ParB/RepB/Spo0J family partition protein [Eubacteriales bacterium OttesenSCG-928-G02]|nr:ParB/RepB/Spo0J family partition protein [Eubacteriales bacterium OttesenSCG-928-G02]
MAKKRLGRGLDALLADNFEDKINNGISIVRLSDIEPNKKQARKNFDTDALDELAASISQHGILQPIIVRKKANGFFEIIAGERRWRASKMLGLSEIPVIIKEIDEENASFISLVENLQRENLNPVEEAVGYRELIENYELTQEEAAKKVGKTRSAVANLLRILNLPSSILNLVSEGQLSYGHARTLLPLLEKYADDQVYSYAQTVIKNGLSVRDTEKYVKSLLTEQVAKDKPNTVLASYYKDIESKASHKLKRKISIKEKNDGKGIFSISYSDHDDLESLLKELCGKNFFEETGDE